MPTRQFWNPQPFEFDRPQAMPSRVPRSPPSIRQNVSLPYVSPYSQAMPSRVPRSPPSMSTLPAISSRAQAVPAFEPSPSLPSITSVAGSYGPRQFFQPGPSPASLPPVQDWSLPGGVKRDWGGVNPDYSPAATDVRIAELERHGERMAGPQFIGAQFGPGGPSAAHSYSPLSAAQRYTMSLGERSTSLDGRQAEFDANNNRRGVSELPRQFFQPTSGGGYGGTSGDPIRSPAGQFGMAFDEETGKWSRRWVPANGVVNRAGQVEPKQGVNSMPSFNSIATADKLPGNNPEARAARESGAFRQYIPTTIQQSFWTPQYDKQVPSQVTDQYGTHTMNKTVRLTREELAAQRQSAVDSLNAARAANRAAGERVYEARRQAQRETNFANFIAANPALAMQFMENQGKMAIEAGKNKAHLEGTEMLAKAQVEAAKAGHPPRDESDAVKNRTLAISAAHQAEMDALDEQIKQAKNPGVQTRLQQEKLAKQMSHAQVLRDLASGKTASSPVIAQSATNSVRTPPPPEPRRRLLLNNPLAELDGFFRSNPGVTAQDFEDRAGITVDEARQALVNARGAGSANAVNWLDARLTFPWNRKKVAGDQQADYESLSRVAAELARLGAREHEFPNTYLPPMMSAAPFFVPGANTPLPVGPPVRIGR